MSNSHNTKKTNILIRIYVVIFCIFNLTANAQENTDFKNLKLNNFSIYLICRGTKAKSGFIAEKFNLQDKNITHIGIGYIENNSLKIFNVSDVKKENESSLVIDSLNSFITKDTYYLSIWEYKNSYSDLQELKRICIKYKTAKIEFDFSFNIEDDKKMYCSEFCSKVLMEVNQSKFKFDPNTVKLEPFYSKLLKKSTLTYYPVDFFETNQNFTKIYDTFFHIKPIN